MTLSDLSLKRPIFATVIILTLVVLGLYSYVGLNIDDMPNIDTPYAMVTVAWPGGTPAQMETEVAKKVEEAVGQVPGVKHITTYSNESVAIVMAEFTMETTPAEATQNVRDKLSAIRGNLPQDIEEPVISKFDMNAEPIISLAVSGSMPLREMTNLVDDQIKPRLEKVNGVGQIDTYGYERREIQIRLDKDRLAAYGITTTDVLGSLSSQNMDVPAGSLNSEGNRVTVRTAGKVTAVEQFRNLPVARKSGVQYYIRDIAEVQDGIKEQDSLALFNGNPAIGIDLIKQSGSNTVAVATEAKQAVSALKQQLPPGVTVDVVRDNSTFIRDSVNDVVRTILEGSLLAVLVVFLFLKDWRSTMISAVALPTSIISTFFAFKLLGYTLNTMTLIALSLAVGLLIDDAIVVIENVTRHLKMGKKPLEAARDGTAEISLAVLATTLTIVAVFLPMGLMSGIIGRIFKPFGITVVFAVLVSLLVSFTVVPILSSRHLKGEEQLPRGWLGSFLAWFNGLFEKLSGLYGRMLTVVLRRPWATSGIVLLLLVAVVMLGAPRLGTAFIPDQDTGEIYVAADLDAGLSLAAANSMNDLMLGIIGKHPEAIETYSTVESNQVIIYVKTVDRSQRSRTVKQIAAALREDLKAAPGVQASVNTASIVTGTGKAVTFKIIGEDENTLQAYAVKAQQIMAGIPGAVDVGSSFKPGQPEVKVQIDQDAASDLGVSTAQIGSVLNTLFSGTVVGQYEDGANRYDVRVRLGEGQRQDVGDLNNIYIQSQFSAPGDMLMIPLGQVSRQVFSTSPSELWRYDKQREIELTCNLEGVALGDFNSAFTRKVEQELQLPPGYSLAVGMESEMMSESFSSMGLALVLGVIFMFFVLAAQFENFIDPLAIILAQPLAIIGAILGLLVGRSQISLISLIGVILLMGLVAKNAILLIDFTKAERERGTERGEALLRAARTRFRPIMMTSLAMILGMTPLALGLGSGAEIRAPMAHAIIGGLITSTMLTLIVVPAIYTCLDDLRVRIFGRRPGSSLGRQGPTSGHVEA